jgi:hypothetical protein
MSDAGAFEAEDEAIGLVPTDLTRSERSALAAFLPATLRDVSHPLALAERIAANDPQTALVHLVVARCRLHAAIEAALRRVRRSRRR